MILFNAILRYCPLILVADYILSRHNCLISRNYYGATAVVNINFKVVVGTIQ